jgi:hypothetical protein
MAINVLLKRSSTASKRPTAAQLDIGELSLNYDSSTAGVFFEDSAGNVRKVGPVEVSSSAPNSAPAGSSGNSLGELWYDTSATTLKVFDGTSFVGTGAVTDGDKGDITVSSSGATWTIDNGAVTFAKIQNITSARLLGRSTAGSGDAEEISIGTGLSLSAGTLSATGGGGSVGVDPVIAGMIF